LLKTAFGALATLLALSITNAPAAEAYSPHDGALFNDPTGTFAGKLALLNHVEATIDSTPIGATILISTYLLDRKVTVDKLIKAAAPVPGGRANSVQVMMDKGIDNGQSRRLMTALNRDNDALDPVTNEITRGGPDNSFAFKCEGSCRGAGGNNHAKFFAFSEAGDVPNIVMVSSANLNKGGAYSGWNDLFTMADHGEIYDRYAAIHKEMADDTDRDTDAYQTFAFGRFESRIFPLRHATQAVDPVMKDLRRVECYGATGDAGNNGRTTIHISMFSWSGTRGMYITDRLLQLQRQGCVVSVIYGAPSRQVAAVLRQAAHSGRINLFDTRVDRNGDGKFDLRVHSKYMLINGNYGGSTFARQVYTGSQNWTDGALTRADEIMLGIKGRPAYGDYKRNWDDIRRTGARRVG
jgi:hypothetical protein